MCAVNKYRRIYFQKHGIGELFYQKTRDISSMMREKNEEWEKVKNQWR
jgi:hypothetical protein